MNNINSKLRINIKSNHLYFCLLLPFCMISCNNNSDNNAENNISIAWKNNAEIETLSSLRNYVSNSKNEILLRELLPYLRDNSWSPISIKTMDILDNNNWFDNIKNYSRIIDIPSDIDWNNCIIMNILFAVGGGPYVSVVHNKDRQIIGVILLPTE